MSDTTNRGHTTDVPEGSTDEPISVQDPILQIRDLNVTFGMDRGDSRVVRNVDLDIGRNEIIGVVGESGSGKSMLASSILDAVVDPGQTSGEITYHPKDGDSVDILSMKPSHLYKRIRWKEISMVFQGALSSFNPTMSIRGHFVETLDAHNVERARGLDRARELFADLYLDPEETLNSYPHQLSGGQKQRALIALSLILEPDVLVMDEPTAALDLLMQRSIINLIDDLQEKYDLTVVFITHDLPLVAGLTDRLAVMYGFEIAEIGPTEEIITGAAHPYTRALLNSVPNLDTPREKMRPIEGESLDPLQVPSGCSYHPRCPLADDHCRAEDPPFDEIRPNHSTKCFHWEKTDDEIPLSLEEGEP